MESAYAALGPVGFVDLFARDVRVGHDGEVDGTGGSEEVKYLRLGLMTLGRSDADRTRKMIVHAHLWYFILSGSSSRHYIWNNFSRI